MSKTKSVVSKATEVFSLQIAPARIVKGDNCLKNAGGEIAQLGKRPMVVGGDNTLRVIDGYLAPIFEEYGLTAGSGSYAPDCCEVSLTRLEGLVKSHEADFVIGVGGGKALDMAKLVAFKAGLPVVTIPTSGATCAGWTALSNIYSQEGAFLYDVSLRSCPDLLILDYGLIASAPLTLS